MKTRLRRRILTYLGVVVASLALWSARSTPRSVAPE